MQTIIDAVSLLLEKSLNFKVKVSATDATEILKKFNPYNDIPKTIAHLPDAILRKIGPTNFKGDNPNNGRFDNIKIWIGNESSLVIYVESMTFHRQKESGLLQVAALKTIGRMFNADEIKTEIEVLDNNMGELVKARFWWD